MTAIRSDDVARRLASPEKIPPLCLVFGPDRGHVSEIAERIAKTALVDNDDPFALVALGVEDVSADSGRIVDEARTVSMFGGRRLVRVRDAGTRDLLTAVEPLIDDPPADAVVLIEAGDLKKTAPLRKRLEKAENAAVVACYPDMAAQLDRLIDAEAESLGLAVAREAREMLHTLLGGDRIASRGEVAKLCLYAHGDGTVTADHVRAIVGDVSGLGAGDAVDAAFLGRATTLDGELQKLWVAGVHPSAVAGTGLKWAQTLVAAAGEVQRGREPRAVVERMTPPVHFRRKADVAGMLEIWRPERLEGVCRRLDSAVLSTRKHPALAREIVAGALQEIALRARSLAQRR